MIIQTKKILLWIFVFEVIAMATSANVNVSDKHLNLNTNVQNEHNYVVYFMPDDGKKALGDILKSIKNANKNIKIAIYDFNNKQIAKALKQASKKGVLVEIIFDDRVLNSHEKSRYGYLKKYKNIQTYTLKGAKKAKKSWGKMHSKYMIIDNKKLFFGSTNYSKNSFNANYEVLYASINKSLINKFIHNFANMLKKTTRPTQK